MADNQNVLCAIRGICNSFKYRFGTGKVQASVKSYVRFWQCRIYCGSNPLCRAGQDQIPFYAVIANMFANRS